MQSSLFYKYTFQWYTHTFTNIPSYSHKNIIIIVIDVPTLGDPFHINPLQLSVHQNLAG